MPEKHDKDDFCPTRQTLLVRVKDKHDEKSWEEFVFYYEKFVYIICRKFGLTHHDCEEMVQKVMVKLWEKLPDFTYIKGDRFRGWIYTITSYTVKDFFKMHTRSETRREKAVDLPAWNLESSSEDDIDSRIEKEWKNYICNLALDNIKNKFSEKVMDVFSKHQKGVSVKALSDEYGLPTNTIYIYIQRVTKKIREEVKHLSSELD